MSQAIRIAGTQIVAVNKYSQFNPAAPEKADLQAFTLLNPDANGGMGDYWAKEGYIHVGMATVEIELMPARDITSSAVTALKTKKTAVLAAAQAEATRIEQEIQSLLAITNEA